MKRRVALGSPLAKRTELINKGKGPANEMTRKASLKKEELEATGLFSEEEIDVILERLDDMPAGDVGHEIHKKAMKANQSAIDAVNKPKDKAKKKSVKESYTDVYMQVYEATLGATYAAVKAASDHEKKSLDKSKTSDGAKYAMKKADERKHDGHSQDQHMTASKRSIARADKAKYDYAQTKVDKQKMMNAIANKDKAEMQSLALKKAAKISGDSNDTVPFEEPKTKKKSVKESYADMYKQVYEAKQTAMDIVRKQVEAKYGKGAIHDPNAPKKEVSPEEKKRRAAEEAKNREARRKESGYDPMHSPRD
jgi:hypothetical protein